MKKLALTLMMLAVLTQTALAFDFFIFPNSIRMQEPASAKGITFLEFTVVYDHQGETGTRNLSIRVDVPNGLNVNIPPQALAFNNSIVNRTYSIPIASTTNGGQFTMNITLDPITNQTAAYGRHRETREDNNVYQITRTFGANVIADVSTLYNETTEHLKNFSYTVRINGSIGFDEYRFNTSVYAIINGTKTLIKTQRHFIGTSYRLEITQEKTCMPFSFAESGELCVSTPRFYQVPIATIEQETVTVPLDKFPNDTKVPVEIVLDEAGEVAEFDERDNIISFGLPTRVAPSIDLRILEIKPDEIIGYNGDINYFNVTVFLDGKNKTKLHSYDLYFSVTPVAAKLALPAVRVTGHKEGTNMTFRFGLDNSNTNGIGYHNLTVGADLNEEVHEINELNNEIFLVNYRVGGKEIAFANDTTIKQILNQSTLLRVILDNTNFKSHMNGSSIQVSETIHQNRSYGITAKLVWLSYDNERKDFNITLYETRNGVQNALLNYTISGATMSNLADDPKDENLSVTGSSGHKIVIFSIKNGLLEIKDLNYTVKDLAFTLTLDSTNDLEEIIESNNQFSQPLNITQDLAIESIKVTPAESVFQNTTIEYVISNKGGLTLYNLSSYTVTNATGGKIVLPSPVYKLVFTATDGIQTQTNEVNISYHERNKLVTGMLKWPITLQGEINLTTEIVPVEMFADSNISNNKNVTTYGVKEETLLAPNCLTQPDEHGFLDLRARAGVYDNDGNLFCSDTGVSVTIDGQTHGLKRYAGCTYAKLVQLPGGDYTATYEADFLDHPKQQAVCTYTSEEESAADVIVYGIGRGSIVRAGQNITLEAVATVSRSKVSGATISVGLAEGDQVVEAKQMTENARGIHSAEMSIPTQPGEYSFVYLMEYQGFTATEIIGFTVTTDPAKVTLEEITLGNRMFIIYPQAKEYTVGQRLPLQVEVIDDRGAALTDITMVAEVYQNGALLDSVALPIHRDGFRALREFTQPANYDVVYKTVVQGVELSERVSFVMGEPTQIAQVAEFAIQVISPQEDVYAENSELIVRVQVTEQGSPVADANVKLVIDNTELQMAYDSFGEYETVIGPLESGEYNIRVVALKQNKVTEERITFIISDKFITLDVVNPVPKADLELELGQPVALRIKALDEASDVVSAVIVRGSILEPSGRKLTLQFTQDPVTGDYTSVFYPNDEGIYKIDVRATKPGFISDEISSTFNVNILVEETQPLTVDTSTVLTIVVALAIIIALITVIRMIL